jgi:hypothetical protein
MVSIKPAHLERAIEAFAGMVDAPTVTQTSGRAGKALDITPGLRLGVYGQGVVKPTEAHIRYNPDMLSRMPAEQSNYILRRGGEYLRGQATSPLNPLQGLPNIAAGQGRRRIRVATDDPDVGGGLSRHPPTLREGLGRGLGGLVKGPTYEGIRPNQRIINRLAKIEQDIKAAEQAGDPVTVRKLMTEARDTAASVMRRAPQGAREAAALSSWEHIQILAENIIARHMGYKIQPWERFNVNELASNKEVKEFYTMLGDAARGTYEGSGVLGAMTKAFMDIEPPTPQSVVATKGGKVASYPKGSDSDWAKRLGPGYTSFGAERDLDLIARMLANPDKFPKQAIKTIGMLAKARKNAAEAAEPPPSEKIINLVGEGGQSRTLRQDIPTVRSTREGGVDPVQTILAERNVGAPPSTSQGRLVNLLDEPDAPVGTDTRALTKQERGEALTQDQLRESMVSTVGGKDRGPGLIVRQKGKTWQVVDPRTGNVVASARSQSAAANKLRVIEKTMPPIAERLRRMREATGTKDRSLVTGRPVSGVNKRRESRDKLGQVNVATREAGVPGVSPTGPIQEPGAGFMSKGKTVDINEHEVKLLDDLKRINEDVSNFQVILGRLRQGQSLMGHLKESRWSGQLELFPELWRRDFAKARGTKVASEARQKKAEQRKQIRNEMDKLREESSRIVRDIGPKRLAQIENALGVDDAVSYEKLQRMIDEAIELAETDVVLKDIPFIE